MYVKNKKVRRSGNLWRHPGGKFRRLGPQSCSDEELLAIIIGSGTKARSATLIAKDIFKNFGSFRGMVGQSAEKFYRIKSLKEVKVTKIAAVFEIARRIVADLK